MSEQCTEHIDRPDWLPEEYDPNADLRERLPIMAGIEGGIELHVGDDRGVVEVVGQPKELHENSMGTIELQAGHGRHGWSWEIVVPAEGEPFLRDVDPDQDYDAYMETRSTWLTNIDVRMYGVDSDLLGKVSA